MAKRGRPRTPTALKIVQGTDRPDRNNPDEPVPTGPLGPCPEKLRAEGKRRWEWLSDSAFWLTDADRGIAEQYCTRWALYKDAQKLVAQIGLIWTRKNDGYTQMNGALQAFSNSEKALMELGAKLGLDPVSRTDIKAKKPEAKTENPFAVNA